MDEKIEMMQEIEKNLERVWELTTILTHDSDDIVAIDSLNALRRAVSNSRYRITKMLHMQAGD